MSSPIADNKSRYHPLSRSYLPPLSPPLTPQPSLPSDPAINTSPQLALPVVPPSPYDPLLTPSFRHSPPRLPSDQPWRFPSPSHPLHSRSREISLSMLVRDLNSPLTKNPLAIGESPRVSVSSAASPRVFPSSSRTGVLDLDTPESLDKLSRSSPRAFLNKGKFARSGQKARYFIQESPLQHASKTVTKGHRRLNSVFSDDWPTDVSPSSATHIDSLTTSDPFTIVYSPWRPNIGSRERHSPPATTIAGAESPVLRNPARSSGVGLGIGLLGPFIPQGTSHYSAQARTFNDMLTRTTLAEEQDDEAEVASFLEISTKDNVDLSTEPDIPPLKKRRILCPEPK